MEKTTVLGHLHVTMQFTQQMQLWLNKIKNQMEERSQSSHARSQINWLITDDGNTFLHEHGAAWREVVGTIASQEIRDYFRELGMSENQLPHLGHMETYRGSWVMDAAILMLGTVPTTYAAFKGTSKDLPKIADGLTSLKEKLLGRLQPSLDSEVSGIYSKALANTLQRVDNNTGLGTNIPVPDQLSRSMPPLPRPMVTTNLVIDARPLASITLANLKSHKVHLSVGISRDSFTLENLGDAPLTDVQIGLFTSSTKRMSWSYWDSYMGIYPLVSPGQIVAKSLTEFYDSTRNQLNLAGGQDIFVDCWVQDNYGIYLFLFFLERE